MLKAMLWSLGVAMVLYVLFCIVLTGMQHSSKLNPASGFSTAFASVGLSRIANVIAVGAVVGIVTFTFSFMMGAARNGRAVRWSLNNSNNLPRPQVFRTGRNGLMCQSQ